MAIMPLLRWIIFFDLLILFCFVQSQLTDEYDELYADEFDHLNIKYTPRFVQQDSYITVLYKCAPGSKRRVSLSVHVNLSEFQKNLKVFQKFWFCYGSSATHARYVRIRLPRPLAYTSDPESKLVSWPVEIGHLKLIMYASARSDDKRILDTKQFDIAFMPVARRPNYRCFSWRPIVRKPTEVQPKCPVEPEVVKLIDFPLVLTGSLYGKHIQLQSYKHGEFRIEQNENLKRARFSIVFWVYVEDYCPPTSTALFCSIVQHSSFNNNHLTPELFFTREGHIVVNVYEHPNDQIGNGAKTIATLPKQEWCRVAFVAENDQWKIYANCLENWEEPIIAVHNAPFHFYSSDILGMFVVGGNDLFPSFRGFIGDMKIYRRVALGYDQLPQKVDQDLIASWPRVFHRTDQCDFAKKTFSVCEDQSKQFKQILIRKKSCLRKVYGQQETSGKCLLLITWKRKLVKTMIDKFRLELFRFFLTEKVLSSDDLAKKLFDAAMKMIINEEKSEFCPKIKFWLEQSACFQDPRAYSVLATFHHFGICTTTKNSTRALDFIFPGVLLNDRLSILALAHRHLYGVKPVPIDDDAAYIYYRQMAETARHEFYYPIDDEVSMDFVRLTNETEIEDLIFDASEAFHWLKQQALRGVAAAQHNLGALMYAGRQGLTRNLRAAAEYFRLGADQQDPSSHFGYGLALLKGQGTKQDFTKAVHHLTRAVEQGFIGAQVALGYYAYEIEKNYTKAAQLWESCFNKTRDINCAHNLAVMWTAGHFPPTYKTNHVKAWQYYSYAAHRGQIDSKIAASYYYIRDGHPAISRNAWLAALWSKSVAEESSALGTIVRRGLEAYRDHRLQASFFFYLYAALAGLELGYFNAGYLCRHFHITYDSEINCIEDLLLKSVTLSEHESISDSYALLAVAEHYEEKRENITKIAKLYLESFQNGDPQGLFNLAQLEENPLGNESIPAYIWTKIGVQFDEQSVNHRYKRLKSIYQFCLKLDNNKSDESYFPCALAYLKVMLILSLEENLTMITTSLVTVLTILLLIFRRT